jgi:hypothetical protein
MIDSLLQQGYLEREGPPDRPLLTLTASGNLMLGSNGGDDSMS